MQRATESNIQYLHAAANTESGALAIQRTVHEVKFRLVPNSSTM